jgi:DNA-directed RNA polymerase specialized sigma24 family protein
MFDSTIVVLERAREGDLGRVRRCSPGRLAAAPVVTRQAPSFARAGANTDDIIQDVVVRALQTLQVQYDGRRGSYLRTSVRNRVTDEIRKVARRGIDHSSRKSSMRATRLSKGSSCVNSPSVMSPPCGRSSQRTDAQILRLEQRLPFDEIARRLQGRTPTGARRLQPRVEAAGKLLKSTRPPTSR